MRDDVPVQCEECILSKCQNDHNKSILDRIGPAMESGIDLGFDLAALSDVDFGDLEEVIGTLKNQDFYEPKARTVPETERFVFDRSQIIALLLSNQLSRETIRQY